MGKLRFLITNYVWKVYIATSHLVDFVVLGKFLVFFCLMRIIALFISYVHYVRFEAFFPMLSLGSLVIMNFLVSFYYFLLSTTTDTFAWDNRVN